MKCKYKTRNIDCAGVMHVQLTTVTNNEHNGRREEKTVNSLHTQIAVAVFDDDRESELKYLFYDRLKTRKKESNITIVGKNENKKKSS